MQDHGRLPAEHISKHSPFRFKITVGCPPCTCPSIRVCVRGVCGVCVCVRCGVRCGVCGAAWHTENPPCVRSKRPCVGSKRSRVYPQNAGTLNTCGRFVGTHGGVFLSFSLSLFLSFSLSSFLSFFLSLFLSFSLFFFPLTSSSLPSFSLSLSLSLSLLSLSLSLSLSLLVTLSFSLCSFPLKLFSSHLLCVSVLNDNDNDRSSSWLSLYTQLSLAVSARVRGLWPLPCRAHLRIMQETTVLASCHLE